MSVEVTLISVFHITTHAITYCLCQSVAVLTQQTESADTMGTEILHAALEATGAAALKSGRSLGFATTETGQIERILF